VSDARPKDPAEQNFVLRYLYRDWRPTRLGRWANRIARWQTRLGLVPPAMSVLEVRGRTSGKPRATPVVIATVDGERYLVSMLGPGSDWVKNVEAARGDAPMSDFAAIADRYPVYRIET
jgi:hypothetical protein